MQKEEKSGKGEPYQLQDYEIEYKLGEGAYGYVFLAARNSNEYAIKEMSKFKLRKAHCQHVPLVQKEILRNISHPGIIRSHCAFQNASYLYLVLDYCPGGQLQFLLRKQSLSEETKKFYMAQLVNILEYLHGIGVVHRDLKPSNLMLTNEGHIKLIDFGTADITNCTLIPDSFKEKLVKLKHSYSYDKLQTTEEIKVENLNKIRVRKRRSTFVGTTNFMSPELIEFKYCEAPADLWALGCILYYLYYGHGPFLQPCEFNLYSMIKEAKVEYPEVRYLLSKNEKIPPEALDLMKKLLLKNPQQRLGSCASEDLSFSALKQHPFFSGLNVDEIFHINPPQVKTTLHELEERMNKLHISSNISAGGQTIEEIVMEKLFLRKCEESISIVRCIFKKNLTLQEYDVEGVIQQPSVYKLRTSAGKQIVRVISANKFAVQTENPYPRLIYTSKEAQHIAQYLNNRYFDYLESQQMI